MTTTSPEYARTKTPPVVLITARELADMMHISLRTLWRLRSARQIIQPLKIGRATRWRLDEVTNWISQGCPPPLNNEE